MRVHGPGLRLARESRGWTLAQLGKAVNLSESRLSKMERHSEGTMPAKLIKIAEVLNVPLGALTSEHFPTAGQSKGDAA